MTERLLVLYLRRETTSDSAIKSAVPHLVPHLFDVVAYRDSAAKETAARWPWHYQDKPRKGCKHVVFNCYNWRAVWLDDDRIPAKRAA